MTSTEEAALPPLRRPWRPDSLLAVARNPRLLGVFIQAELGDPYQGTVLGKFWDYVRPLVQFFVYFVVIGIILGLRQSVPNFGIYVFCGVATVHVFNTSINRATRSLSRNTALIRRVNVPAEAMPIAAVLATSVRERASLIMLVLGSVAMGLRPNHLVTLPFLVAGILLLLVFASGLGMITSVASMYVKDTQYAVSTLTLLVRWVCPVLYPWTLVQEAFHNEVLTTIYLSNPITVALMAVRETFWVPTIDLRNPVLASEVADKFPPFPVLPVVISVFISIGTLLVGQWLIRRTEHRVASRVKWN